MGKLILLFEILFNRKNDGWVQKILQTEKKFDNKLWINNKKVNHAKKDWLRLKVICNTMLVWTKMFVNDL